MKRIITTIAALAFLLAVVVAPPSDPAAAARCGLKSYTGNSTYTQAWTQSGTGYCRVQARIARTSPSGYLYLKYSGWGTYGAYVESTYGTPYNSSKNNCARFREYDKPYNGNVIYTSPWSCK